MWGVDKYGGKDSWQAAPSKSLTLTHKSLTLTVNSYKTRPQVNFKVFTNAELQPLLDAANAEKEASEQK